MSEVEKQALDVIKSALFDAAKERKSLKEKNRFLRQRKSKPISWKSWVDGWGHLDLEICKHFANGGDLIDQARQWIALDDEQRYHAWYIYTMRVQP